MSGRGGGFGDELARIRNFAIIAHIDHGKSTLADRLLERTRTLSERELRDQVLDTMDLERERGITIKSHAIRMTYEVDGERYTLNLIDTPGHVDFTYEVSRALAACEGALLVVDASQGIEAQTVSNLYLALEQDLEIIPVVNKIDLPHARPEEVSRQIVQLLGCSPEEIVYVSARTGEGVDRLLRAIVERIPPPVGDVGAPLKALIFDSRYDTYRGVIMYVRVMDGEVRPGMRIRLMHAGEEYTVEEVGVLRLRHYPLEALRSGMVGYVMAGIREPRHVRVGDTVTDAENPAGEAIRGFRPAKPFVFAGFYPASGENYQALREALDKLRLNDPAIVYEPESSPALGLGFRVGFLGLLHMEIVQERLAREFGVEVVVTVPTVSYRVKMKTGEVREVRTPSEFPNPGLIEEVAEPYVHAQILTPSEYVGGLLELCMKRRGRLLNQVYLTPERVQLEVELPLAEILFDFYDRLKSVSRGYASFDYQVVGYKASDLVKLDILLNGKPVDALSFLVHRSRAYEVGRRICRKLKETIPRQLFEVAIQAAIGSRVIARETLKPLRKDVTAKCYGGDVTRKRKLLEKQKEGKKRLKQIGKVQVPQEAFLAVMRASEE